MGFKMSLPILKAFQLQRWRAKKYCTERTVSLALHQQRNYIIYRIFFAGTAERNPSIRFSASSFFGSDWLNKQLKIHRY